jgi:HEAT repeat protein
MLPLVARDSTSVSDLILALYRDDPPVARRPLAEALGADYPLDQIAVAWIAGATGDPRFRRPLLALLDSPIKVLRLAAIAGLERIADPRTRPALVHASRDPDYEVRDFAERALRALPPA